MPQSVRASDGQCVIGPQIAVRGRLSGEENLIVQGRIEGNVSLAGHMVVAEEGDVEADVEVESIEIRGQLRGDIVASGSITIKQGAHVIGNVKAPRVMIEDGAKFDGTIDMDVELPEHLRKSQR